MPVEIMKPNDIGFTHFYEYVDSFCANGTLDSQLTKNGIPFEEVRIPLHPYWESNTDVLLYTSPKTGKPVAVLAVNIRYEIDDFAIRYYYREGTTKEEAQALDWAEWFQKAEALLKESDAEKKLAKQQAAS
jgi:hypothetical protein